MYGKTSRDRIRYKNIRGMVGGLIEDKMRESRLSWFGRVYRRSTNGVVRRSDMATVEGNTAWVE